MLTPIQSRRYAQLVNNFDEKKFYAYYNHLGEGGTVEDFFGKVEKHGEHDQSTHGSWAAGNFDEENEYEGAMSTYSERYGITNTGTRVGMTEAEHRAVDDYSQNGYRRINQFLRGSTKDSDLDKYDGIAIVQDNERMNEVAIEEWQVKNEVSDDYEMDDSDLNEAAYEYAFSGKHSEEVLSLYNEGKSPASAIIKGDVDALDSLIDKSPSLFGDKTLYRVYSNNTLANLQEGDIVTDKGFLSTTRIDVTQEGQSSARTWMASISNTPDTVGIILPSESKSGKGLAVDIYRTVVDDTSSTSDTEKEILLPRGTPLKFIGYKTDVGVEARVAIFQRLDK